MHRVIFLSILLACLPNIVACNTDDSDTSAEVSNKPESKAEEIDKNKEKSDKGENKSTDSAEKETSTDETAIDFSAISAIVQDATLGDEKKKDSGKKQETAAEEDKTADSSSNNTLEKLDDAANDVELSMGEIRNSISAIVGDAMQDNEGKKKE